MRKVREPRCENCNNIKTALYEVIRNNRVRLCCEDCLTIPERRQFLSTNGRKNQESRAGKKGIL